jgi:hypothetical protein
LFGTLRHGCSIYSARVRKRLTAFLLVVALWLSHDVRVAAQHIDQQQLNSSGGGSIFNTTTWVGQTFEAGTSGVLTGIDVSLFCFLCAGTNPDVIVEVRTTSGGLPTATVLATTTIPGFSNAASTFQSAIFARPAVVAARTTYAFTLHSAAARATGNYAASFSTTAAAYPNGARVGSANSGTTWTITGSGFPSTPRDLTFRTLIKLTQQIAFAPLADRIIGEADFTVAATATSGLPVSFSASGACSVSGTTIHIVSVGPCAITATQAGDSTYVAADPVTRTFAITYAPGGQCLGAPGHQVVPPLAAAGSIVARQDATIPVKFRVCDVNGVSIGTPGVVTSFTATDATAQPLSTTPDTAFRWDPVEQQWIFNLSTKNLAAGVTYTYRIALADGSTIAFSVAVR